MIRTHKIQMYPNADQAKILVSCMGYSRYCYNKGLENWNKLRDNNLKTSGRIIRDNLKANKSQWESEYPAFIIDTACEDVEMAFKMFFKKFCKFPSFKSKRKSKNSFRMYRKNDSSIRIKGKIFEFNRNMHILLAEELRFSGIIKTAVIIKDNEKFFISVAVEIPNVQKADNKNSVGIDFGLKNFITTSDNEKFGYDPSITNLESRKKLLNKRLSRKSNGSNKYKKARIKLSNIYERIRNKKHDNLHKLSSYLTSRYSHIAIEDLSMKNIRTYGKRWRNKLNQFPWYEFVSMLTYKAFDLRKIDRFFPSSQTCSSCGMIHKKMRNLSLRILECDCGIVIDRDYNAAINICKVAFG